MASLRTTIRRFPRICTVISHNSRLSNPQLRTQPAKLITHTSYATRRNFFTSTCKLEKVSTCFEVQSEEEFDTKVLKSSTPMVVDFHAEWCGPCKLLGPKLEKAVDGHDGEIILAKVNIDELSDIAMQYEVKVVPTVVAIKGGEKFSHFEGNIPDHELDAFLKKLLMK